MTDHLSPEDIERSLERERAELASNLDDLKDKFSLDTIVRQAIDQIRVHGDDISVSVTRAVKANPLGVAVTGVGLAWLIFGDKTASRYAQSSHAAGVAPVSQQASGRHESGYQSASQNRQNSGKQDRHTPSWLNADNGSRNDEAGAAQNAADKARAGLSQTKAQLSDASDTVRDRFHDTAETVRDKTDQWRARLSEGTDHLSEEGRARVVAAREQAYQARDAAMSRMKDGKDRAVNLFEDHPLVAGALAVAVGAAFAAALPHTRIEDEHFGETSDALIRKAEQILSEETEKLGEAMETAADAASDMARQMADKAGSVIESAAESVEHRFTDEKRADTGSGQAGSQQNKPQAGAEKMPATGRPRPIGDMPS